MPVVRTARRKSIALKPVVTSNQAAPMQLLVPAHLSDSALRTLLQQHQAWIAGRLQSHVQNLQNRAADPAWPKFGFEQPRQVIYLGEPVALHWHAKAVPESAPTERHIPLCIDSPAASGLLSLSPAQKTQLKRQLQHWYLQQAQHYFAQNVPLWAARIGVQVRAVQVKTYKSRWGSCYSDGRIQFNWKLLQAPAWVVDYVIVHELCHLHHPNHSSAFWALVSHHYPQTPQAKRWLKTHGAALMAFLTEEIA